jgi:O-antigen ligase
MLALADGLGLAALAGLAVITLADRGATRMHAWPWSLVKSVTQLLPLAALALRTAATGFPFRLPSLAWCSAVTLAAVTVLVSALASPFRGPSMLGAAVPLGALAAFFLTHDWLARKPGARDAAFARLAAWCAVVIAGVSIGCWLWLDVLPSEAWRSLGKLLLYRNASPLGHSTYTAGLALLLLPWPAVQAWRAQGRPRLAWAAATLLVLAMLFTSGSRGGIIGLAALAATALLLARLGWKRLALFAGGALVLGALLALANPRFRSLFQRADPGGKIAESNLQRSAMLTAGLRMGADRPIFGWGPETTPLVFPRYRAGLAGGAENYLQLHSTPVQLFADHGAPGLAAALAFVALVVGAIRRLGDNVIARTAVATLAGYAAFSLTDAQLDVPIFAFALAALLALLAAREPCYLIDGIRGRPSRTALAGGAVIALALVSLLGHRDPAPELNVRALSLARDPANADQAIALLRQSLALNRDQEIVHFNLGWLLVTRDPATAETHFLAAAHLVPDKGGVYFGVGLARLNRGRPADAARAFALECLNDPAFLASPWWNEPGIAGTRDATRAEFTRLASLARSRLPLGSWPATQLARVAALAPKLGEVPAGPERRFTRERIGYPVLTRNLDLPPPSDLFLVREPATPPDETLPPKGWLPSPLLLELLDAPAPPTKIEPRP